MLRRADCFDSEEISTETQVIEKYIGQQNERVLLEMWWIAHTIRKLLDERVDYQWKEPLYL